MYTTPSDLCAKTEGIQRKWRLLFSKISAILVLKSKHLPARKTSWGIFNAEINFLNVKYHKNENSSFEHLHLVYSWGRRRRSANKFSHLNYILSSLMKCKLQGKWSHVKTYQVSRGSWLQHLNQIEIGILNSPPWSRQTWVVIPTLDKVSMSWKLKPSLTKNRAGYTEYRNHLKQDGTWSLYTWHMKTMKCFL